MSDDESKATSESDSYEAWLRREIEAGLKEADDPNAVWFTPEESEERMQQLRAQRPLEATAETVSYEEWLKLQIEIGARNAHAPGAVWSTSEEVRTKIQQLRKRRRTEAALEKAS
jgi:hypothetical protein